MDEMWNTRTRAISALETELHEEATIIYQAFSLFDKMIAIFNSSTQDVTFCNVTGLTLLKARTLAQGSFSMLLDGLAQEAGALLRPLVECLELLTYFYNEPQRVNEALEEKLPSAGEIGKRIQGKFQNLRNYLNEHASHFSFAFESMSHLIDFNTGNWKVIQPYNKKVLKTNMTTLFAVLVLLLYQAANCLAYCGLFSTSLEERLNAFKKKGYTIFVGIPQK